MGLVGAFGALAVGAWAIPSFAGSEARPWLYEITWIVVSFAIVIPLLGLLRLWALTARAGKPTLGSPLIFALGHVLVLLVGAIAGAVQAIEPLQTLPDGEHHHHTFAP